MKTSLCLLLLCALLQVNGKFDASNQLTNLWTINET